MQQKLSTLLAGLAAFLVVVALVLAMQHYTAPAPLNASRAAERAAALKEVRETAQKTLTTEIGRASCRERV